MKAITVRQPWASLIAAQVKTIETRSWATKHRGPIAIHAGATVPRWVLPLNLGGYEIDKDNPRGTSPAYLLRGPRLSWPYRLPLGAIVATAELVDCVPVEQLVWHNQPERLDGTPLPAENHGWLTPGPAWRWLQVMNDDEFLTPFVSEIERPFGDYSPGRWAWLLADVRPLTDPVPYRGKQGLWTIDATTADGLLALTAHLDELEPGS